MQLLTDQQITVLLALINGPRRRVSILRPRPTYLPHPCRRLPRVQGVVKLSNWALMRL